ncbi:glycosyltransferase [Desulfitobacterium sp. THU1]|uniref:glycosyltransferase n=1 Tax=Desulfitobacterium sp. THU1 TaxID=3138072 RepID=UPI00311EDC37
MAMPKVSVVIPTYNHARYVPWAVESVLRQNYPNLEIIVINDGSTDDTAQRLQAYENRIQVINKSNGGTANALNHGLQRATGDYICWLSADDMFLKEKLIKQVQLMEDNPEVGFCYTSFIVIDENGLNKYTVTSDFHPTRQEMVVNLHRGCFINGSSVMMRSSALERVGPFDEGLPQAHDYELWFRFLRHFPSGFIREPLISYRWHGENMSLKPATECIRIVQQRATELFPEWLGD